MSRSGNAEALAQRAGDQPRAGRRADQGEGRTVDADRPCRRALADDQVELKILHRRIKDLLDRGRQPVDLVDEQDVARLQVGQQCGEVAAALDHRARGRAEANAHFAGDDLRERRLAEPRRSRRAARGRGPRPDSCAASIKTRRLSRSWRWPTNSASVCGRREASTASCSEPAGSTVRGRRRRSSGEFLQPGADQRVVSAATRRAGGWPWRPRQKLRRGDSRD